MNEWTNAYIHEGLNNSPASPCYSSDRHKNKAGAFIWDAYTGSAGELEAHTICRTLLLKEPLWWGRPSCGEARCRHPSRHGQSDCLKHKARDAQCPTCLISKTKGSDVVPGHPTCSKTARSCSTPRHSFKTLSGGTWVQAMNPFK